MRVALISPYLDIYSTGMRTISSCLRKAGHETKQIFIPSASENFERVYPEQIASDVLDICKDVDLVGFSLMSNHFSKSAALSKDVPEKLGKPVLWGGIHCTVRPDESIEHADYVCLGEGDDAAVELVDMLAAGKKPTGIQNLWIRHGNEVEKNSIRPTIADLDRLPHPDYSMVNHFILNEGRVVPMTHELQEKYLVYKYMASCSRGCILNCSFCCHNAYRKIYGTGSNTRRRSVEHVMEELKYVRDNMPYIRYLVFDDEFFMDASIDYIKDFSAQYKEKIGLPFMVTGFIPVTVTEDKTEALVDAGLFNIRMGIQSGAQNTKRIYRRNIADSVIVRAATIFDKFRTNIRLPVYDMILDNPWETDDDRVETMQLLQKLPRPFRIIFYSLTFFPGTDLYTRAKEEGIIQDDIRDIYQKDYLRVNRTYMNGLAYLFGAFRIPKPIEKVLLSPAIVKRKPDFLFYPLWFLGRPVYLGLQGLRDIFGGNFIRVNRYARVLLRNFQVRAANA
ncbi:MAG: B12-binding domain-containing radical SAM protein [Deltaproteobacteria bacterium]|nr:B12-binding domain-containing radical SAM protein [Deltaproteobacteria bacterium]